MKKCLLALVLLCFAAAPAAAITWPTDCGAVTGRNDSVQYGDRSSPWLQYTVETSRGLNFLCLSTVRVDGWVVNAGGSADSVSDAYTASLRKPVALNGYGWHTTNSNHFWKFLTIIASNVGNMSSSVEVKRPPVSAGGPIDCSDPRWWLDKGYGAPEECATSPLLIDTAGNGYKLSGLKGGVRFDIDGDGKAEQVAWTREDTDNAWLALDRNGNGVIDDGSELFGNNTPVPGLPGVKALNGFAALKFYDDQHDGVIDKRDQVFAQLLLWTDVNHNGFSEPTELQPVCESDLLQIYTDYKEAKKRDKFGNEFRQRARGVFTNGNAPIFDVWLVTGGE